MSKRIVLVIGSLLFFGLAGAVYASPMEIYSWDVAFTHALQAAPRLWIEPLMRLVSAPGYFFWTTVGLVLAAVAALWYTQRRRDALCLLLSSVLGMLSSMYLKRLFARPRPTMALVTQFTQERGFGFPSGHVVTYVVIYGCLYLILSKLPASVWRNAARLLCAVLVLFVGPSRIYLGAHWPSDVLASYALGACLVCLCWLWLPEAPNNKRVTIDERA